MPISFELSADQKLIVETAERVAASSLWPNIRSFEAERRIDRSVLREIHELGLTTLMIPEDAGGPGLGVLSAVLVDEKLAWGDGAAPYALGGPGSLLPFVLELGNKEQQKRLLAPYLSSESAAIRGAVCWTEEGPSIDARVIRSGNGWLLRGRKKAVLGAGAANAYVVFAQVDDTKDPSGLGVFVVDAKEGGVAVGARRRTLGLDAAEVADIEFRDVWIDGTNRLSLGENETLPGIARAFAQISLLNAARLLGIATRTWEVVRDYCEQRHAFGKPIAHFQAVAFTVADRLMEIEGARWLTWKASANWDKKGAPDFAEVAAAAAAAQEVAVRTGDDGVQLFGGAGFIRDYPVEKCFRDARQMSLMGPSTATLDALAADIDLGLPPDPGAILPTFDLQPRMI